MGDDVVKRITIKYSNDGMEVMTRQVDNYNRALKQMTTSTQMLNSDKVWTTQKTQITNVGASANRLGSTLNNTMMRFIGLNAVIGYASQGYQELRKFIDEGVDSFRSFEVRMAEVSSILDNTTRDTLPSLEVGITNLSVKFGRSVDDLTKGLYEIVSAAFDVDEAMSLLNVITIASIAGLSDLEGTAKTFTGVLNSYGQSAAHAAVLSDQMFEAVIRGNFTFKDLQNSLGYVTPIAANLGVSFEEVAAALATATRQGQHIDSVTRGLGLLMQGIVDPTNEAAEAAKKYGIDMSATALRTGGLTQFFNQLSVATSKYGAAILPELIGNMRSLRVAMALTGETGITGFTEDMYLMQTATGKTNEALTQMMNTQQMMADILEQSMQKVERSIGEAWSGVDIWWKKSQLWWGTLLSGGDADKAIQGFDSAVFKIRQSYLNNLVSPAKKGEKTVFDKLTSGISVKQAMPLEALNKYSKNTEDIQKYNNEATAINTAKVALLQLKELTNKPTGDFWNTKKPSEMTVGQFGIDPELLNILNEQLTSLDMKTVASGTLISEFETILGTLNNRGNETVGVLESLQTAQSELQPTVDQVTTAFEDMATQIQDSETNIITLQSEINKLNEDITTLYKGFEGKLGFQLAVSLAERDMDKFSEYSSMAAKYGSEYINEWTNVFDKYGNNMSDVLKTIYEYNDALEATSDAESEAAKKANDLQIAMAENNIQMLKLQLIGMIRRRGNTRAEQREMKQLQIENTKLRIEEMQRQYDADVKHQDDTNSAQETAYEKASKILSEYTDTERHALWVLKDTRDEDIADLQQTINEQKTLLAIRTSDLANEFTSLNSMQSLYQTSLITMAKDPAMAKAYKDFFGTTAMEDAMATKIKYDSFMGGVTTPEGVAPYSGPTPTTIPYVPGPYDFATDLQKRGRVYANGTDYVPSTGLAIVHQGERITPAGQSGNTSILVNINNAQISNDYDVTKMAKTLENVIRADLIDKRTGKSKHRMA